MKKTDFWLWNTERISYLRNCKNLVWQIQIYLNLGNLENQRCWLGTQEVTRHRNMAQIILLLYAITNEKTVKLMQIDRLRSASKTIQQKLVPITMVGIPYFSLVFLGIPGFCSCSSACWFRGTRNVSQPITFIKLISNNGFLIISWNGDFIWDKHHMKEINIIICCIQQVCSSGNAINLSLKACENWILLYELFIYERHFSASFRSRPWCYTRVLFL